MRRPRPELTRGPTMPSAGMPAPPQPPFPTPSGPLPVGLPVGTVVPFAGALRGQGATDATVTPAAPYGWLVCDGGQLHRAKFPELFAAIGYRYLRKGESPGVLYRLPDFQGYFLRGVDPTGTIDPDNAVRTTPAGEPAQPPLVGSVQTGALQLHEHTYQDPTAAGTASSQGSPANLVTVASAPTKAVVAEQGGPAVLTSPNETRAINVDVYFIIKFTNGVFPWTAPLGGAFGV